MNGINWIRVVGRLRKGEFMHLKGAEFSFQNQKHFEKLNTDVSYLFIQLFVLGITPFFNKYEVVFV